MYEHWQATGNAGKIEKVYRRRVAHTRAHKSSLWAVMSMGICVRGHWDSKLGSLSVIQAYFG